MAAAFLPSVNAFSFTNAWPREPAVSLDTPFGTVAVGDASKGLCGGMTYAALDYFYAGRMPQPDRPAPGSPLYAFLVRRLVDSWHVPAGVAQYYQWMNLPDSDQGFDVLGHQVVTQRGVSWRTVQQQWPVVKEDLDDQRPSPLGLVTIRSSRLSDLGWNHQVLAYAYATQGSVVTLHVYDPNSGQDDAVTIAFDTGAPTRATTFTDTVNITRPIRGFFRTAYSPVPPP